MDEIEVIRTIEELRKFLNDKNFMEIVVRQKNKRFKKFYKVALDNIFKEAEQQQAAKEVLKAVQKNSKLLNKNMKMMKNLSKIQNIALILDGVNLVSTWATFAILYEKLNSMEEEIVGAIEKVQQSLNKGMELHVKAEYNRVISDYQDMLDCRKKQKPYSEEQMRKLVDSLYVVLDMMIASLKSNLIDNKDNMILTVFMMLSMYTASLRFFDEQYYFNYKDILSGDEVWHTSHNKWMSLYDTLTQSWFIELLQDHGVFDLGLNTDEMDTYYKEFLEQVQDQKQEVIDNQEIILTLQDTSLLNVFHEKTSEEIQNELEKEILRCLMVLRVRMHRNYMIRCIIKFNMHKEGCNYGYRCKTIIS